MVTEIGSAFKIGDVVKTKIHKRKMTISDLLLNDKIVCVYFVGSNLRTKLYDSSDLTIVLN